MASTVILTSHIVVGALGVILGPLAVVGLVRGWPGWVGSAYHLAVALVCVSAVGLAALDFGDLWFFVPIAAGSYALAAVAVLAIGSARLGWKARAVRGFGGAYIALWTAILVVSVPDQPITWAVPTVAGGPALEWFAARVRRSADADGRPAST